MDRSSCQIVFSALATLAVLTGAASAKDDIPRPEHPRPDFERQAWQNLNGTWQFALRDKPTDDPGVISFDRTIVVPFPWQSRLSTVAAIRDGVGWYRRSITVPEAWKGRRVFLRFGAVDQEATVWLDGQRVGENKVAYIPFELDVTDRVRWGQSQTLIVRAVDLGSQSYPKGKQQGWYTPSGGIWQTVWLEARPATYVDHFRVLPDVKNGSATFEIDLRGTGDAATVSVRSGSEQFPAVSAEGKLSGGKGAVRLTVRVPEPKLWTPDRPYLYDAIVEAKAGGATDEVRTYFGLREVSRGKWKDKPYEYILLNGEPIYLRTALDQSFNPEGLYTAPSDRFLQNDMAITKASGLNGLRIHIKVEEPRRLYWADRLGVLILADIPNCGSTPPVDGKRCRWEDTWRGAIRRDFNHPCIIVWVLFNETWGIRHDARWDAWIEELYHRTKKLDPTRLCEDNSPCRYDHVITDVNSWHFYINDYERARGHIRNVVDKTHPGSNFNYVKGRKQNTEPLINSEYGGISAGSGDADISWCVKYLTNELRLHPKICGYVYTELSDIEWEHNGIVNYDRSAKEYGYDAFVPGMTVADVFAADFLCMDVEPCPRRRPGETLEVPLKFSHFGRRRFEKGALTWTLHGVDRSGRFRKALSQGKCSFDVTQYDVVDVPPIRVKLPDEQMVVTLACEVAAVKDGRCELSAWARNYINVDVIGEPQARVEVPDPQTLLIRWDPLIDEVTWPPVGSPADVISLEKRSVEKDGAMTYRITWPEGVDPKDVDRIEFVAELASRAGKEKYDWPGPKGNHGYPQTQARKFPSDVEVVLAGQSVGRFSLVDDPADARGVLSHANGLEPGSYGYLTRARVEGKPLAAVLQVVAKDTKRPIELTLRVPTSAAHQRGVAVFGDRVGRYPTDPTLMIHTRAPHGVKPRQAAAMKWVPAVPTALDGKPVWRYTTAKPAAAWFEAGFDDSAWERGRAGFGRPRTPGARIFTKWLTGDIWLRKPFELPDAPVGATGVLRFHHDEDMTVYLNGKKILERKGYLTRYQTMTLPAEAVRLLRKGSNVLAVHCRQTGGGQYIDVGLSVLAK